METYQYTKSETGFESGNMETTGENRLDEAIVYALQENFKCGHEETQNMETTGENKD
ncbi:MAG: hypothetical protein MJA29_03235 [Candidatus Omnitrophica bacterium]|nr:hypothetical protein [Candidatus Omnitrophota bacterium]